MPLGLGPSQDKDVDAKAARTLAAGVDPHQVTALVNALFQSFGDAPALPGSTSEIAGMVPGAAPEPAAAPVRSIPCANDLAASQSPTGSAAAPQMRAPQETVVGTMPRGETIDAPHVPAPGLSIPATPSSGPGATVVPAELQRVTAPVDFGEDPLAYLAFPLAFEHDLPAIGSLHQGVPMEAAMAPPPATAALPSMSPSAWSSLPSPSPRADHPDAPVHLSTPGSDAGRLTPPSGAHPEPSQFATGRTMSTAPSLREFEAMTWPQVPWMQTAGAVAEQPDPLRPDVFAAIANSLFQGAAAPLEAQGVPTARAKPPASYVTHAALGADRRDEARPAKRLDIETARDDFPILHQKVHGRPLVWLDNAATTQKPRQVVEKLRRFYYEDNSNVHRGAHTLAARATDAYEEARGKVAGFLGAASTQEVVFVRGTTEAINLVASSFGRMAVGADDEIVLSELEHHSNIVPWQFLAQRTGARIRVAPVDGDGNLRMDEYAALLNRRTRIVAMTQVSNAIGTVMPVTEVTAMAHRVGARVLIDGAQSVQHMPVDVQAIGCDFFCLSGHKIFGPTGIGALYGRRELLEQMPPWQGGGSMIESVTFEQSIFAPVPAKFEAGTPILAGAVGLGAALDYVSEVGLALIERHESALMARAVAGLSQLPRLRIIGNPQHRAGALSFVVDGMDAPSIGAALDQEGIAVRSGHHCAQPALAHFGLKASVRPSFALYNTIADVDALIEAMERIICRSA